MYSPFQSGIPYPVPQYDEAWFRAELEKGAAQWKEIEKNLVEPARRAAYKQMYAEANRLAAAPPSTYYPFSRMGYY